MSWQDIVLSVGSWIFIVAVIPMVMDKNKPPLSSSLMNGVVLLIFAWVYLTLHLWLSVASTGLLGLVWLFLAVQKYQQKNL